MRYFTTLCIFLLTALPASALELSLEECLRLAEQNDRTLQAAQAQQQARGEEVAMARKNFFPALKVTGDYTLLDRPPRVVIDANAFGSGLPPEDVDLYGSRRFRSAGLILEQPLFRGGALRQELLRSQRLEEQARLETLRHRSLLRRDTQELFFRALNARLLRQSSEKLLTARQERLRVLEELLTEGYVRKEDLLRQRSELAFAEAEARTNHIREQVAGAKLKNALYLDQPAELVPRAPKYYRKLAAAPEDSPPETLTQRTDYLALEQQVMAADAEVQKARGRLYPQISMFGQYTRQDDTALERDEVWAAGARLEWTIFEWGKNLAEIRRAQADRLRLRHQRDAYAQEIKNEATDLWGAVREKEQMIEAWVLKTELNETLLERAMEEFREGKNTLSEVLAQEAELVAGYNDYRREINELGIALAHLQAALAVPLDEWLVEREIHQLDWTRVTAGLQRMTETSVAPVASPASSSPLAAPARSPRPSPPAVAPTDNGFVIQVGAFADRKNAEELLERVHAALSGQPVEIATVSGAYKVRLAGFPNEKAALALLPVIRQKLGIDGFLIRMTP